MSALKKLRFLFSFDGVLWLFLAIILIITYFKMLPQGLTDSFLMIISVVVTIPVLFSALRSLKNKKISTDLLASIALIVSLIEREWTSVIFINLMITSARILSDYTKNRSRNAIKKLLKLKPQKAKVKTESGFVEVPIEQVKNGDLILVGLGERIPVDGIVEKGEGEVDQSSLTGESLPVFKKIGDEVFSSTMVSSGNLTIRTEKIGEETTFAKIIHLVEESQKNKAPISTFSDKFSALYIIATLTGSFLLYVIFRNVSLVLSVLLVSCADELAIAIPLAFISSITHAARHGAIVKGGDFIEALTKSKVLIVDKTGTLTFGRLKVEKVIVFNNKTQEEFLELACSVSLMSKHPSARAIAKYVKERNVPVHEPENFTEYSGKGAVATYENKKIFSGKVAFFEELKIKMTDEQLKVIEEEKSMGFNTTLIGLNDETVGFVTLSDEIRPQIRETISELKKLGIEKTVMLTGDNEKIAQRVADEVGVDEFYANLLPEDKLTYLKKYMGSGHKTLMIGDGINDAAALSLADVGIAMGVIGTDAAIESADIALMRDDLTQLPELMEISKSTLKVVYQNLFLWAIFNIVGITLVFAGILDPDGAAAYNFIFDFVPLINSLRLFR